jgi:hypothetical protein
MPFGVDRAQRLDLRRTLAKRVVLEMRRDHADVAYIRSYDCLDRDARHARDFMIGRIGKQVPIRLQHRKARQDHVAETTSRSVRSQLVDRHARNRGVAGQQRGEHGELVFPVAAGEERIREVVGNLLQAKDVEVGDALRVGDYARGIDLLVDAAAPLDIPGDELHFNEFRHA